MTIFEGLSIGLAGLSLIISVISYSKATSMSIASIELYINERITNTKEHVDSVSAQMAVLVSKQKKTPEQAKQLKLFGKIFRTAVENNLNAYEEACGKYLDRKVNKKGFAENYKIELQQLVENQEFGRYFDRKSERYSKILKVNDLLQKNRK